jgi:APA family basic amino acid/polyamine antiporter
MDKLTQRRELGIFDVACVVIGGIIGVGIFFTPGTVAQRTASPGEMLAAWGLGGLLAAIGALVFAELSTRAPGHGGIVRYIHAAFGPLPAFLFGWANWLVIQAGALGVVALVLVDHLVLLVAGKDAHLSPDVQVALAIAAMLLFTGTNLLGLAVGKRVQNALTVAKVILLALLALCAFFVTAKAPPAESAPVVGSLGSRLASAILPVLFAIGGWQQGSFLAGAARRPQRDVPLGILLGVGIVIVVYLMINIGYLSLLGFSFMANTQKVGADAATAVLGEVGGRVFGAMVVISAAGIMNTICMAPPYVLYAMAKEGLFPRAFGTLSKRYQTPVYGVLCQGLWAVLLLLVVHLLARSSGAAANNHLGFLCDGVVFVDWLFFMLCGLALLLLRRRGGKASFSVPGGAWLALLFALGACAVTVGALLVLPLPSLLGVAIVLLGLPVFWWFRSERRAS